MTLLLGEEGAGKTTLVKSSVLPLMERRARNLASAMMANQRVDASGATPSPDRRMAAGDGPNAGRYASVFFDQWDEAPLAGLRAAIDDASRQFADNAVEPSLTLADALIALARERSVHFLIVLDRFEAFLAMPESSETREFADQLVAALNTPFLPANFLISMRDNAEPLLESLAQRVPGFGDARLRVLPLRRAPERSAWGDPVRSRVDRGESLISKAFGSPPLDFDITTGAAESASPVEAEHAADRTAIADASETRPADQLGDLLAPPVFVEADRAADGAVIADASETPPAEPLGDILAPPVFDFGDDVRTARPAPARRRWPWLAAIAAAGALLFVVVGNRPDGGAPVASNETVTQPPTAAPAPASTPTSAPTSAPTPASSPAVEPSTPSAQVVETPVASAPAVAPPAASEPTPAATPGPAPAAGPTRSDFTIAVDAENNTATRVANDLAKAVARDGLVIDVRAASGSPPVLVTESLGEPRLIIARRDAMEAARRTNDSAMATKAARILMPLWTEELYFVVRADSPLRFVHQIENKRINIGAPNGARAATAMNVYQAMFGKAMPAATGGALDVKQALDALTRDRSIDAIVLVASQPASFLTNMPQAMRQRIKLLRHDSGDLAQRRALRSFLPATLRQDANRVLPYQNIQTLAVRSFLLASPPADPAGAERLEAFTKSLCRNLPALRREGDPHWREVRPGLALDTGWPDAGAAATSLRACGKTSAAEPRRKRRMRRR